MLRSSLTKLLDYIQEVKDELQALGSLFGLFA